MGNVFFSSCHSLRLIPISGLNKFAVYNGRVRMVPLVSSFDADAIPGSVKVSNTLEDGIYKVKITFNRTPCDADTLNRLKALSAARLIATYVDEAGKERVAGSPDYPLKMVINEAGAVINATLTGQSRSIPLFLEVL